VSGRNRIQTVLDHIAEIPDTPDTGTPSDRLRDVMDRFGLRLLDPKAMGRDDGSGVGRALLVGWNRTGLERAAEPEIVSTTIGRRGAVTRAGGVLTALELRSERQNGRDVRPSVAAVSRVDRWAILPLDDGDAAPLGAAETAVLRMLAAALEKRLGDVSCTERRPPERSPLSRRERECLEWTSAGKTTWEIAAILEISQNTVDGYIASATRKLGAVNRAQAVAEALRRGLID
jgi:DNA-binding CsgD family transcriptional regulator